jgi:hypothetical protein
LRADTETLYPSVKTCAENGTIVHRIPRFGQRIEKSDASVRTRATITHG